MRCLLGFLAIVFGSSNPDLTNVTNFPSLLTPISHLPKCDYLLHEILGGEAAKILVVPRMGLK